MMTPNSPEGSQQQPVVSGPNSVEIALGDPLKAETRKARLYLLGVSMVGITIVHTGLVPQEITTLGITFGEANRQSLLVILALVVLYFLIAFAVYGLSDFFERRVAYATAYLSQANFSAETELVVPTRLLQQLRELPKERFSNGNPSDHTISVRGETFAFSAEAMEHEDVREIWNELVRNTNQTIIMRRYSRLSPAVLWVRAMFEFLLPLLVGFYAIYALLSA